MVYRIVIAATAVQKQLHVLTDIEVDRRLMKFCEQDFGQQRSRERGPDIVTDLGVEFATILVVAEQSQVGLPASRGYRPDDDALRTRIKQIAEDRPYYGYRLVWGQLRREGWRVNHKRVHRIWREEGLDLRRRRHGKRSCGSKGEVEQRATHPDNVWSYDICEDRTERGRQLWRRCGGWLKRGVRSTTRTAPIVRWAI